MMDAAPAPPVKDFLLEADLLQYFEAFTDTLKVTKTSQLKFVVRDDLVQIGMSGPEQRRYKKVYARYFPNPYLSIFKKILGSNKRTEEQHIQEQEQPSDVLPFFNSDKVSSKHVEYIIHIEDITINKELGMGQFGVVQQGTWTTENQRVQVAIKCLGSDRMTSNSTEFLKEAAVMHTIDHPNIVRLYGVVLHMDSLMLVTELAPLRSLLECLNEIPLRPSFPVPTLCDFAEQICDGMTYLENKRLIHRDLAARNILVFTKDKVKISDFGLSRALGVGKDYYQTNYNVNLKLPVAWCAPECILYLRFTSASDVWAYAVCLWEMFTYGFQPWAAFSGQQILENIDEPNYQRLERPECCPDQYYKTMLECWSHDPQNRPKFKDLGLKLRQIRPEQVQAVTNSQRTEKRRNTCLEYKTGDVITILGKENSALWYGVLPGGACGLFDPNNTKPYVKLQRASSLSFHSSTSLSPSLGRSSVRLSGNIRSSLLRTDTKRHTVTGKRTIERSMISSPQSDVKHTGHIGLDGAYFGDLTFLDPTGSQPPRQVVTPYKPSVDLEQVPLINPNSPSHLSGAACSMPFPVHADELLNGPMHNTGEESQNKSQHKNEAKSNNTSKKKNLFVKAKSATISKLNKTNSVTNNAVPANDSHEYHEITDAANLVGAPSDIETETSNVPDSPTVPNSPMDFSQSLIDEMDTMFRNMDSKRRQEINRSCEENRCQSLNKFDRKKPPRPSIMKTMSAQEQKTLDTAVALANEITTRSMTDLGKEAVKVPASPSERMKFNFKLSSRAHPHTTEADKCSHHAKQERRNFSEEANSVPDIQSTLTKESKLAYTSLIEQPTITTSIISNMATGYVAMTKPDLKAKPLPKPLSGLDGLVFSTLRSSEIGPCDQDLVNVNSDEIINVIPLPPRNTKPKLIDKPRHFRKYPLILPNDSELQNEVIIHPAPKTHTNVYHNFPNFQQHNSKNKVENTVKCPSTVQYYNLNVIEEDQIDGTVKPVSENNPDTPKTEAERFELASNMPLEKETLTKDCTDHVSVEDLLEFADQKPCGRQRGVESDEVRIMCKVLKNEVEPSSCLESLELTNWNVHQAIKIMRIKISIGERTTLDECCKELSDCNGDVLKALSNLMTKYEKH